MRRKRTIKRMTRKKMNNKISRYLRSSYLMLKVV